VIVEKEKREDLEKIAESSEILIIRDLRVTPALKRAGVHQREPIV